MKRLYFHLVVKKSKDFNFISNMELKQVQLDFNLSEFLIYPNPSRDIFNVSFSSSFLNYVEIKVINLVGELIYSQNIINFEGIYNQNINLKENKKGIYFLEITTKNGIIKKKLVLQ